MLYPSFAIQVIADIKHETDYLINGLKNIEMSILKKLIPNQVIKAL